MSSIVSNKVGNHTYLYESESYRDERGKPQTRKTAIGKIDNKSGSHIYRSEYLEKVNGTDKQPILSDKQQFSVEDIRNSEIKEFGLFHLLEQISEKIGLSRVLQDSFPVLWEQILSFAFYIVATGEPAMYCEDWLSKSVSLDCGKMSSQRISELLVTITNTERILFFEKWGELRSEDEFFALDITSVSSYSEFINDVEWGYNRDSENLKQINVCMLLGEKSKLPIFQTTYNGSLKDVSTLKTTLQMATSINLKNIAVVMDKGFCSTKNVNSMLSDENSIRFLMAMPFSLAFAKNQVKSEQKDICELKNTINIGKDVIRGITKERSWSEKHKLFTHTFFNPIVSLQAKNQLYGYVTKLKEEAILNPENPKYSSEFDKYLIIRKSAKSNENHTISIRNDVVENEIKHVGWLVLVSNHIQSAENAIGIYRSKDVVEKGFMHLKNCLDLARLRVHQDNSMQNKTFIGFIALILVAHIHKIMSENNLYSTMTMKKLIKTLEKLRIQYINKNRILYPLSREQKNIFSAFGINEPL